MTDFDQALWRLADCVNRGIPPHLSHQQLRLVTDEVVRVTAHTPVRYGDRDAWSERRAQLGYDGWPLELTPGEVMGLCLDALEHRFAVNLRREYVLGIIGELRRGGVSVASYDTKRRQWSSPPRGSVMP